MVHNDDNDEPQAAQPLCGSKNKSGQNGTIDPQRCLQPPGRAAHDRAGEGQGVGEDLDAAVKALLCTLRASLCYLYTLWL